jgi:hypothetical protein
VTDRRGRRREQLDITNERPDRSGDEQHRHSHRGLGWRILFVTRPGAPDTPVDRPGTRRDRHPGAERNLRHNCGRPEHQRALGDRHDHRRSAAAPIDRLDTRHDHHPGTERNLRHNCGRPEHRRNLDGRHDDHGRSAAAPIDRLDTRHDHHPGAKRTLGRHSCCAEHRWSSCD